MSRRGNRWNSPHTCSRVFTLKKLVFTFFFVSLFAIRLIGEKFLYHGESEQNNSFQGGHIGKRYQELGSGQDPTPMFQSVHSTHRPSSLMHSSQCIRRQTLHSWGAKMSSFSCTSPHATHANSSLIVTPPSFIR